MLALQRAQELTPSHTAQTAPVAPAASTRRPQRAEGFVCVFDLTDRASFESVARWMKDVETHGKPGSDVVLVGNKCDMKERAVGREEADALAAQYKVPYYESSAKEDINVEVHGNIQYSCYHSDHNK
jgi:GTPase SAR1 family protein